MQPEVFLPDTPLDVGIARQGSKARAGGVEQNAFEENVERQSAGIGADRNQVPRAQAFGERCQEAQAGRPLVDGEQETRSHPRGDLGGFRARRGAGVQGSGPGVGTKEIRDELGARLLDEDGPARIELARRCLARANPEAARRNGEGRGRDAFLTQRHLCRLEIEGRLDAQVGGRAAVVAKTKRLRSIEPETRQVTPSQPLWMRQSDGEIAKRVVLFAR